MGSDVVPTNRSGLGKNSIKSNLDASKQSSEEPSRTFTSFSQVPSVTHLDRFMDDVNDEEGSS